MVFRNILENFYRPKFVKLSKDLLIQENVTFVLILDVLQSGSGTMTKQISIDFYQVTND